MLFQPRAERDYTASAPLAAKLPSEASFVPILSIELCGSGRPPRLRFDREHTLLPAVPLGVTSRAEFRIINDGYDNVDLRHRLPADAEALPMALEWPEGTLVGIAKASVGVVVTFKAAKPIAFTANLEFMDQDGARLLVHYPTACSCSLHVLCIPVDCLVYMDSAWAAKSCCSWRLLTPERSCRHAFSAICCSTYLLHTTFHGMDANKTCACRCEIRHACFWLHRSLRPNAAALPRCKPCLPPAQQRQQSHHGLHLR